MFSHIYVPTLAKSSINVSEPVAEDIFIGTLRKSQDKIKLSAAHSR